MKESNALLICALKRHTKRNNQEIWPLLTSKTQPQDTTFYIFSKLKKSSARDQTEVTKWKRGLTSAVLVHNKRNKYSLFYVLIIVALK
jgi:hypothetical protein